MKQVTRLYKSTRTAHARGHGFGTVLFSILLCALMSVGCNDSFVDSFNRTPITSVTHKANWFDHMLGTTDATTYASLRVDSGYLGSSQCTLFIFSKFCNGIFRIRLGLDPSSYTLSDRITKPAYCSDSTSPFTATYIYTGLTPNTKYYFDIMAFWGPVDNYYQWQLDSCFTTQAGSSSDTATKAGS